MILPIMAEDKKADAKDAEIAALKAQLASSQAAAELWQAKATAQANACFDVSVARALIKAVDAEQAAQAAQAATIKAVPKEPSK